MHLVNGSRPNSGNTTYRAKFFTASIAPTVINKMGAVLGAYTPH